MQGLFRRLKSLLILELLPAARAIMTTDRYPKLRAQPAAGGRVCGIAKGAGMIEPNMATMLAFVLTDVAIPRGEMQRRLTQIRDSTNVHAGSEEQPHTQQIAFVRGGMER